MKVSLPKLISGGLSIDDRGSVTFANDFDFKDVKRFYMVSNHDKGFVRAWHGHKKEGKYVLVTRGAIKLAIIKLSDKKTGFYYILSANNPQILFIPPGYYNGFKTLTDDAQVMFFSTLTMEEADGDDYRMPANAWDVLDIEER